MSIALITAARRTFHQDLLSQVLLVDKKGVPGNADSHSRQSILLAKGIVSKIKGDAVISARKKAQASGAVFEHLCEAFIRDTFRSLSHLRPGMWDIGPCTGKRQQAIAQFDQYEHLAALSTLANQNPELAAALGSDYLIKPDVVIARHPETDEVINAPGKLVDQKTAQLTSLRASNSTRLILHASISCKWTIRSDRAQNARSEGLNLVRNRKGRLPHIVVITGEPTPNRIASVALGTGDIDCVYHFALPELVESAREAGLEDASEMLETMIEGKRLRDIADLPLDLVT